MSETGALTGGTAELWVNGRKVAYATGCQSQRNQALVRIDVLGNPESEEILVDGAAYSMTASQVWSYGKDWYDYGVAAEGGIAIVNLPACTVVWRNNANNETITSLYGLKLEGMTQSVDRGRAVMSNVSMQGTTQRKGTPAVAS